MNTMTTLKNSEIDDSINLYVAFHTSIDTSPHAVDVTLSNTISTIFTDSEYGREWVSERESGGEIVYRFQKPLLKSETENKLFFEKLKTLFIATVKLNPHFTQSLHGSIK